jgi:hypothetical protein
MSLIQKQSSYTLTYPTIFTETGIRHHNQYLQEMGDGGGGRRVHTNTHKALFVYAIKLLPHSVVVYQRRSESLAMR